MNYTPIINTGDCGCGCGDGTGVWQLEGCAGGVPYVQVTTVSKSAATVSWVNLNTGVSEPTAPAGFAPGSCADVFPEGASQDFVATAGQTVFTLTTAPKGSVWFFRNGARLKAAAATVAGADVTYVPAQNGGIALLAGDEITIDYVK